MRDGQKYGSTEIYHQLLMLGWMDGDSEGIGLEDWLQGTLGMRSVDGLFQMSTDYEYRCV